MKRITLTAIALSLCLAGAAQSLNIDMSPVSSSLRSIVSPVVNIVCAIIAIVGCVVVAAKYHKERDEMLAGFVQVILIVGCVWGVGKIAVTAFLS